MKKGFLLLIIILFSACFCFSQTYNRSVVSAAGGNSSSANYKLDWTLGEIAGETGIASNSIYTQGFNQPGVTVKLVHEAVPGEISVIPNPVQDQLNVVFKSISDEKIFILITDESGRQIIAKQDKMIGDRISLSMAHVARGAYFLVVKNTRSEILGTFRIIKN